MRPVGTQQSAIRAPLNTILATEANVRLLRVLTETRVPLTQAAIAQRTGLNASGAGRSLAALEELGIVEYVGSGSRRAVVLRAAHPLATPIMALFASERARFDAVIEQLKTVASSLTGPPRSVWIDGPVAAGDDTVQDAVTVGVLTSSKELARTLEALAEAGDDIGKALDVTIEFRGLTAPDLAALTARERSHLATAIPILGPPPSLLSGKAETSRGRARSHAALDAEARSRGAAIAEQIRLDPGLVEQARVYILTRFPKVSAGEQNALVEWDRILRSMSLPRLRRFLVDPGERATRLRQTMPFFM